MIVRRLLMGCWFTHQPMKVLVKGKLHFVCEACHQDLGVILPKQKLKVKTVITRLRDAPKFQRKVS